MEIAEMKLLMKNMATRDGIRDADLKEPTDLVKVRNISYGPYGSENLLDIYYPESQGAKLPVIVSIHGGGYFYGDKELYRFYTMALAKEGFVVLNFNYRLAPAATYPAPLEDTNNVMAWLVANQADYPVDLEQLFIVGDSAGGQLAEQYATMQTNPAYGKLFPFPLAPIKIKGLGLNCGVYFIGTKTAINADFPFYFGEELTESISEQFPVESYLTAEFPPTSLTTATDDFLRDLAQPLAEQLVSLGVQATAKVYRDPAGGKLTHVFHINQKLAVSRECNQEQVDFFKSL
ncbi:alpha/beta hydrolase [Vagococcus salmoninarum]|uniref:alpha/beta hydrolase n=1 Tax=Vagococcus salmoninarum TaxID=2739 RepID=UPI001880B383|nr:alpha/beta hydrolase [Vagococcus salmoninarum]MBE9389069.1 alpha/beta hydrolase [Vagococcus salmoninarum]